MGFIRFRQETLVLNRDLLFVSYQRDDSQLYAATLAAALNNTRLPVFVDTSTTDYFRTIPEKIATAMARAAAMVVLIGNRFDPSRLNRADNLLRFEIDLARANGVFMLAVLADIRQAPAMPAGYSDVFARDIAYLRSESIGNDVAHIVQILRDALAYRGVGYYGWLGSSHSFLRGERVRVKSNMLGVSSANGMVFHKKVTGSTSVVVGSQTGSILGVNATHALVRWDSQRWTKAIGKQSTFLVKEQLPPFDAWITANLLERF